MTSYSHSSSSSTANVVGVHYRVGKKIGEGSFGVIFEGTNLLNSQTVAIKFVRPMTFLILPAINPSYIAGTAEIRCSPTPR